MNKDNKQNNFKGCFVEKSSNSSEKVSRNIFEDFIESEITSSFIPLGYSDRIGNNYNKIDTVIGVDFSDKIKEYKSSIDNKTTKIIPCSSMLVSGNIGSGKSTILSNIANYCLAKHTDWIFFGIDGKSIDLVKFRRNGAIIGTTLKESRDIICYVQKVMKDRFDLMKEIGINNWSNISKEHWAPKIMLLIDDVEEILPKRNKNINIKYTDYNELYKEDFLYREEILESLEEIARLGSSANVYLVISSKRPDNEVFTSQLKGNLTARLGVGYLDSSLSQMLFSSKDGTLMRSDEKGEIAFKINEYECNYAKSFNLPNRWIDSYLLSKDIPLNVYGNTNLEKRIVYKKTRKRNPKLFTFQWSNSNEEMISEELTKNSQYFNQFDEKQQKEIEIGLLQELNVSIYAKPEFDWGQMQAIRGGLEKNLDVFIYAKPDFDAWQMLSIKAGLLNNLDVAVYAKPEFNSFQMNEIRYGLEKNLDVSIYAKPEFHYLQMEQIRLGLEKNLDVSVYAKSEFNCYQMEKERLKLENNRDL